MQCSSVSYVIILLYSFDFISLLTFVDHSAPTNVRATAIAPHSVEVTWDNSSSDVTGYLISYSSATSDVTSGHMLVDGDVTCYTLTNLEQDTQYTITVQAVTRDNAMSVQSDKVSVTTYKNGKRDMYIVLQWSLALQALRSKDTIERTSIIKAKLLSQQVLLIHF